MSIDIVETYNYFRDMLTHENNEELKRKVNESLNIIFTKPELLKIVVINQTEKIDNLQEKNSRLEKEISDLKQEMEDLKEICYMPGGIVSKNCEKHFYDTDKQMEEL